MDMVEHPEPKSNPTPEQAILLRSIDDYRRMRSRLVARLLDSERAELPKLDDAGNIDLNGVMDLQNTIEAMKIVGGNLVRASLRAKNVSPFVPVIQFHREA